MTGNSDVGKFPVKGLDRRREGRDENGEPGQIPRGIQPIGIQLPAILFLAALALEACSARTEIPAPWGESQHETGPVLDPDALRDALEWDRVNAQTAEKALDAYYRFGLQHEQLSHRARVRTPWTRLARHAAEMEGMFSLEGINPRKSVSLGSPSGAG